MDLPVRRERGTSARCVLQLPLAQLVVASTTVNIMGIDLAAEPHRYSKYDLSSRLIHGSAGRRAGLAGWTYLLPKQRPELMTPAL